jgi:hypothetical protein
MDSTIMTRVSKATLVLVAAATILLTVSIVISKARYEHSPKEPSQVVQTGHSHQASLLFGDTKIMASQAIAKYRSLKPLRASDHFHRWRFEALRGAYSLNRDLQVEIDRMLTQSAFRKSFPGSAPLFFRSPYGWEVRQRTAKHAREHWEYEHHVDQFLATCAEIGVPLSLSIETTFGRVSVGDLLEASRRSFDTSQEPCWTLVAYCTYLPEEPQWQNRFGESCSYESIIEGILSLPSDSGSCGGTHKQFALAYFLRGPSSANLSASLRQKCEEYLARSSTLLESSQLPNGAWSPLWAKSPSEVADASDSGSVRGLDLIRITGHQLEWIGISPPSSRPSINCISRALHFVAVALNQVDQRSIHGDYCAYSHAACVLRRTLLSETLPYPLPLLQVPSAAETPANLPTCQTIREGSQSAAQTP